MRIPKRFKLLDRTIQVEWDNKLDYRDGYTGLAMYRSGRILLQPSSKDHPISKHDIEQVFLHELIHHCLHCMEQHDLCSDEKFVNMMAGFIHQAFTTAEYK